MNTSFRKRILTSDSDITVNTGDQTNVYDALETLTVPCRHAVLKQLRVRDLFQLRQADPRTVQLIDSNHSLLKEVTMNELPVLAKEIGKENPAEQHWLRQLIKTDRVFHKFTCDEVNEKGRTHVKCIDLKAEGVYISGPIRSFNGYSVFETRLAKAENSIVVIKPTVEIEGKNHTTRHMLGETLHTSNAYVNHIVFDDNRCVVSKQRRMRFTPTTDVSTHGLAVIDITAKATTFSTDLYGYQMVHAQDNIITALRATFDVETDIFDLRLPKNPVRTIQVLQTDLVEYTRLHKCTMKVTHNGVYLIRHTVPGFIALAVDHVQVGLVLDMLQIPVGTPDSFYGYSWNIDVQGDFAIIAYNAYDLPHHSWIKIVLINLTTMTIEQDFSEAFKDNFRAPNVGIRVRFTLLKLKYDFVVIGVQNYVMVFKRHNPIQLYWSSADISDHLSYCYKGADIDYAEGDLLIRNCQSFNRLTSAVVQEY